jgi:hypothetical protein
MVMNQKKCGSGLNFNAALLRLRGATGTMGLSRNVD